MGINLAELMALGTTGVASAEDVYTDVKAAVVKGGGVPTEAIQVVENLIADEKFKADLAALVVAIKAIV